MPLSKYAIAYAVLTVTAALLSLLGAGFGLAAGVRRRQPLPPDARHRVDQRLFFAFSALGVGIVIRLAAIPLWFLTLQTFVPVLPGAICLVGVHQAGAPWSWLATGLKLALPMLYAVWLILTLLDRRLPTQPLLALRTVLLAPIAVFVFFEAAADLLSILTTEPVTVSCCLAPPATGAAQAPLSSLAGGSAGLAATTVLVVFTALLLSWATTRRSAAAWLLMPAGVSLPLAGLFVLHSRNTPVPLPDYFVNRPMHHCLFCQLQATPLAGAAIACLAAGGALALAYGAAMLAARATTPKEESEAPPWRHLLALPRRAAVFLAGSGLLLLFFSR